MSDDSNPPHDSPDLPIPPPVFPPGSGHRPVPAPDRDPASEGPGLLETALGEVTVTGMGNDPHVRVDPALKRFQDPHVAELAAALGRLDRQLNERGEAALKVGPEMSRFEATLRAYCVGYLAGRRAQDTRTGSES